MFALSSTLHSTQYCLARKFYATLILLKTITKFDCLVCCLSCFVFAFQHFSGPTPGQPTDNVGYWSLFSSIAVNKTWSRGPESGCLSPVRGFLGPVLWRRVRPVIGIIGAWSPTRDPETWLRHSDIVTVWEAELAWPDPMDSWWSVDGSYQSYHGASWSLGDQARMYHHYLLLTLLSLLPSVGE